MEKRPLDTALPSTSKRFALEQSSENSSEIKRAYTTDQYESTGLRNSLHGVAFQWKLLMITAKRCHNLGYLFRLATEFNAAYKFDDLVLWYKKPGDKTEYCIFLQAKHLQVEKDNNTKIKLTDLVGAPTYPYSLQKYFISFKKIKENNFSEHGKFYIYTNNEFEFDENFEHEKLKKISCSKSKRVLYLEPMDKVDDLFKFNNGQSYKFVSSSNPEQKKVVVTELKKQFQLTSDEKISDNEIEDFIDHLVFAVNQPNETELSEIICNELGDSFNLIDAKLITNQFQNKIVDWLKQKKGTYLTEVDVDNFFDDLSKTISQLFLIGPTSEYANKLKSYGIEYKIDELDAEINKFLSESSSNKQIFHMKVEESSILLGSIKVNQIIQQKPRGSFIFVKLSTFMSLKDEVFQAFRNESNNLLVIECDAQHFQSLHRLHQEISNVLSNKTKKILFIAPSNNALVNKFKNIEKDLEEDKYVSNLHFNNLNTASQAKLFKTTVSFQGMSIALNSLFSTDSYSKCLIPVADLVRDETLTIDKPMPISSSYEESYYIERSFTGRTNNRMWKLRKSYYKNFGLKNQNVNLLELIADDNYVNFESNDLKELLELADEQKLVMISNSAGMGKSTALTHLSKKIKRKFPTHWVATIDLNDHISTFEACMEKKMDITVLLTDKFMKLDTEFEKELFLELLKSGRVVLLLDGLDEISPLYEQVVINIISELKQTQIRQLWITSREHLEAELEKTFGIQSWYLVKLTPTDQLNFLEKFWSSKPYLSHFSKDRLTEFGKNLIKNVSKTIADNETDFLGIPLHVLLIAEYFEEDLKYFCTSNSEKPNFGQKFYIIDLYHHFIQKKFGIYQREKCKTGTVTLAAKEQIDLNMFHFEEVHHYHALHLLLHSSEIVDDFTRVVAMKNKTMSNYEEKMERVGIVKTVSSKIEFIHRTYAEYFLARLLMQHIHLEETKKLLTIVILVQPEYKVVRKFLNDMFAKEQAEHVNLFEDTGPQTLVCIIEVTADENNPDILFYLMNCIKMDSSVLQLILSNSLKALMKAASGGYRKFYEIFFSFYAQNCWTEPIWEIIRARDETELLGSILSRASKKKQIEFIEWFFEFVKTRFSLENLKALILKDMSGTDAAYRRAVKTQNQTVIAIILDIAFEVNEATLKLRNFLLKTEVQYFIKKRHDSLERASQLLKHGADVDFVFTFMNKEVTLLYYAFYMNHPGAIQFLLNHGADINFKNDHYETLLHFAAEHRYPIVAELLIKYGADIHTKDKNEETPLHWASRYKNSSVCALLLNNGAVVNVLDKEKRTPLYWATRVTYPETTHTLLQLQAHDDQIEKPLHWVVRKNLPKPMQDAIERGVCVTMDVKIKDIPHDWSTGSPFIPLGMPKTKRQCQEFEMQTKSKISWSNFSGLLGIIKTLKEYGGRLNSVNMDSYVNDLDYYKTLQMESFQNEEPSHDKDRENSLETVRILLQHGADVKVLDDQNETPLHWVIREYYPEKVKILLEHGAYVNALNKNNETPLDLAMSDWLRHRNMINILSLAKGDNRL